ncbi:MAG TPA: lytic transglycosylase domain-containing protein [Solirubrobacteraceae bacterium]|nr:lytic transglycosylase domain-containing protein [Solirubrobacteraceae bacterium]
MLARIAPLLAALALGACGADDPRPTGQLPAPTPTATATPTPAPTPAPQPAPDPGRPIPHTAAAVAADLEATQRAVREQVRAWRRDGDPGAGDAPPALAALAARAERIHRELAPRRRRTARVLPLLPPRIRAEARDTIAARRALDVLNAPRPGTRPPKLRTGPPEPADVLRRYYGQAERRSNVSAILLAAVNLIESDFGRVRNESVAGAQGPMQFMPSTWESYGRGGDIQDPRDAILAAGRFLAAAGAATSEAGALYRYNPSQLYVTAVSRYARIMRRDPLAMYALFASGAPQG